mgnify:CR=1 FL=1
MIKSVKWFFVVLVIGSLISLGFSKESIPAEKLKLGDAAPQCFAIQCSFSTCTMPVRVIRC